MSKTTAHLAKLHTTLLLEKISFMYKVLGMREYIESLELSSEQEEKFQAHFNSIYDFAHNVIGEVNESIQESREDWNKELAGETNE